MICDKVKKTMYMTGTAFLLLCLSACSKDAAAAPGPEVSYVAVETTAELPPIEIIINTKQESRNAGPGAEVNGSAGAASAANGLSETSAAPAETKAPETTAAPAETKAPETTAAPAETKAAASAEGPEAVALDPSWRFADYSKISSGSAMLYRAQSNRKNIVIGVNAGHGTKGGTSVKTWCHPDKTPKVTGGTTSAGNTQAVAVSSGMSFSDGTPEAKVTLQMALILKEKLLNAGYDVLMIRETDDVQLDNVARTVICNNRADCHIALHWDGDGLSYDKGCFFMSVPDGIKYFEPVSSSWEKHEALGAALIGGLKAQGLKIFGDGTMDMDLTQTSFSSVPSVDIELGNQSSDHGKETLGRLGDGLLQGINAYFGR